MAKLKQLDNLSKRIFTWFGFSFNEQQLNEMIVTTVDSFI